MKFVLTGDAVYSSLGALQQLGAESMPATTALVVARILKAVRTAALEIQEQREIIRLRYAECYPADHATHAGEVIRAYKPGTKPEDQRPENADAIMPQSTTYTPEKLARVTAELEALGAAENEIECPVLSSDALASLSVKPDVLGALLWNIDAVETPPDVKPNVRRRAVGAVVQRVKPT